MPGEYKEVRTARPTKNIQGQEAPIVIYSMITSTLADAPRGMGFLYFLNRLNVAMSRAKALSILVCSPALFEPECRASKQMKE
jgi:superfamily I DNA and/or RNA helicase